MSKDKFILGIKIRINESQFLINTYMDSKIEDIQFPISILLLISEIFHLLKINLAWSHFQLDDSPHHAMIEQ